MEKTECPPNFRPRLCHLTRWPDFVGYGFNLESNQFIGKVDDDSPAMLTDLREGDILIEVNGVNVLNQTHEQVVDLIKTYPNEARLLVVDESSNKWFEEHQIKITSKLPDIIYCKTPMPRPVNTCIEINLNQNQIQLNNLDPNKSKLNPETNLQNHQQIDCNNQEQNHNLLYNDLSQSNQNEDENEINQTNQTATNDLKQAKNKSHNFIVVQSEQQFAKEQDNQQELEETKSNQKLNQNHTLIKMNDQTNSNANHNLKEEKSNSTYATSNQIKNINISSENETNNDKLNSIQFNNQTNLDLNLDMSASEMRKLIASRRNLKTEAKKASIDLRRKYEIIQQM